MEKAIKNNCNATRTTRRELVKKAAAIGLGISSLPTFIVKSAKANLPTLRFASGGGVGPNEMQTVIFLDYLRENVLPNVGRRYNYELILTRGTPEAGALLAAGQVDGAVLSYSVFSELILKNVVREGLTIVADSYVDGETGFASNAYLVRTDSGIKSVQDLRGKTVAVNAFGSAIDVLLRAYLRRHGIDPRTDVNMVEVNFANMGPALRAGRIDLGSFVLPFLPFELIDGQLTILFETRDVLGGPHNTIFQAISNKYLWEYPDVVAWYLEDYVTGLQWYTDPRNRKKALELISAFTKTPEETLDYYFARDNDYFRHPSACVDPEYIQRPIDLLYEEGVYRERVEVAKYVNLTYLPFPCA